MFIPFENGSYGVNCSLLGHCSSLDNYWYLSWQSWQLDSLKPLKIIDVNRMYKIIFKKIKPYDNCSCLSTIVHPFWQLFLHHCSFLANCWSLRIHNNCSSILKMVDPLTICDPLTTVHPLAIFDPLTYRTIVHPLTSIQIVHPCWRWFITWQLLISWQLIIPWQLFIYLAIHYNCSSLNLQNNCSSFKHCLSFLIPWHPGQLFYPWPLFIPRQLFIPWQ